MFRSIAQSLSRNVALRPSRFSSKPVLPNAYLKNQLKYVGIRNFSDDGTFSNPSDVVKGHVKWFDLKKGFGFIVPTDGSEDVFVHQTSIHAEGFRCLAVSLN